MKEINIKAFLIFLILFCLNLACIKSYNPAVQNAPNAYLVVDGLINTQGITTISLSRTQNLGSTNPPPAEIGALVILTDQNGKTYSFSPSTHPGSYTTDSLSLPSTNQYRLQITTANGEKYQSDPVSPKPSPPIDSITWKYNNGVNIYVNTHDINGKTQYYRWQYTITYEYHSKLMASWGLSGNMIYPYPPLVQFFVCYPTLYSDKILVGNSLALNQDLISEQLLTSIPINDSILNYRLSIQVIQTALNPQSYAYWNLVKNNSQSLGTLFDLQPSQLTGNIHCISNPNEPVVGYLSAGSVSKARIFINNASLPNWQSPPSNFNCLEKVIPTPASNNFLYTYPDSSYAPYYFQSQGSAPPLLHIAKKPCLDCRIYGQTNSKPSYW